MKNKNKYSIPNLNGSLKIVKNINFEGLNSQIKKFQEMKIVTV